MLRVIIIITIIGFALLLSINSHFNTHIGSKSGFRLSNFSTQSIIHVTNWITLFFSHQVSGVCACLQDSSVLVQRSMLDFLLMAFPMHNGQLTRADVGKIVEAAVNVVLRRDMSLNRRLYAWFLGTSSSTTTATLSVDTNARNRADSSSTTSEMDISYFQVSARDLVASCIGLTLDAF